MSIRTLVVDDEGPQRQALRKLLERSSNITVIGECNNGIEAIAAVGRMLPDLVFLDVQMPEMSGFDVLQAIPPDVMPLIVLVSAVDDFALRAFEVQALDYLLKPVYDKRLQAALGRAQAAFAAERDVTLGRNLAAAIASWSDAAPMQPPRWSSDRVAIPTGDRIAVVRVEEIDWVEASGNYVSLHVDKKIRLLRETIATMEQRLALRGFVRIHRSTLVNMDRIQEIRATGGGEFDVILRDGTSLKVSRNYRAALTKLVGGIFNPQI